MNLTQLKYFETLAKTGHLMRTAEMLYVTPPTISKSLKALEDELGTTLFDRVGRNLVLNERGQAFLPYVVLVMQTIEDGKNAVNDVVQEKRHIIRFSIRDIALFSPFFSEFPRFYSDIILQPIEAEPDETGSLLWDEKLDFMMTAKDLSNHPKLVGRELYRDYFALAVSENHPLAKAGHCSLRDLTEETFLVRPDSDYFQSCVNRIMEEHNFYPKKIIPCNYASRPYMVHGNAGIAVTTEIAIKNPFCTPMTLVHVDEFKDYNYTYCAYWRKDHKPSKEETLVMDGIANFANNLAYEPLA